MVKVRLHGTCEEVGKFKAYLETLAPRVKILCSSDNYADKGKSEYVRSYLDVELKEFVTVKEQDVQALSEAYKIYDGIKKRHPIITRVKPGIDIRQLVHEKYSAYYESLLLWALDWSDIDGVLDYLYGILFTAPTPQPQVKEIIDFIEQHCEGGCNE